MVFADPMIEKVFFNLLENAVRHGGKITGIRLFSEKRDADLILVCEDDGVGIGAGEKELIFDKEYGKNTGLGLFLAREILDISGITLRETGEPGRGARFEMRVPRGAWRVTR
jgi:signal transduction histidine kinase